MMTVDDSPDDVFDDVDEAELLQLAEVSEASTEAGNQLSEAQKSRAEKNRRKALALKQARLTSRPYPDTKKYVDPLDESLGKKPAQHETKLVDTNAGFFIEEDVDGPGERFELEVEREPAPVIEPDRPTCLECREELADSYLFRTFDHEVCDNCRDTEKDGKHELITKTDIKNIFLLKDHDLDQRQPPLKFIVRKNPHNPRWGDMKLYLRLQVEERALEVWGSEEALEAEHTKRDVKKDQVKAKKFAKKLKTLRMQVRGSLYKKEIAGSTSHEHQFGEETYDEESDMYSMSCSSCGHTQQYEKM